MSRTTIDFGIDLGTTNSAVACLEGTEARVIKNNENHEITPSAVWLDRKLAVHVGHRAKYRSGDRNEHQNVFMEFKIQMGTSTESCFQRSGRRMKPEELSAEVLKSLKADVLQQTGEELQAAVITVPAAFDLPQNHATERAAKLAGITRSPLLQEPIAAALAYGFQSQTQRAYWLVYDLGGGTFDAAVVQLRDGAIRIVNHGGDSRLGGQLIDWAIVESVLVPYLTQKYRFSNFQRGNPQWEFAFNKLKLAAEEAKILLSRKETVTIDMSASEQWQDEDGEPVEIDCEVTRGEVERLAEPFILRSINTCKAVLTEKRLTPADIEKVLLVGGPTMMPYLRERLADARQGLGIALDYRLDPLTVVARGAAIFAGTQRLETSIAPPQRQGEYRVQLEYEPIGSVPDPLLGGRVSSLVDENLAGFTIEFVDREAQPMWHSGKIALSPDGFFETTLWAEKGRRNTFHLELCNAQGARQSVTPESLSYTIGQTITAQTLTHNVGVALANNQVQEIFAKGDDLPARRANVKLKTVYDVQSGAPYQAIRIPIVEGGKAKADRNRKIGSLEIPADKLRRDVPAGSDVEIAVAIDASRTIIFEAFIPLLDEFFDAVLNDADFGTEAQSPELLEEDFARQGKRLEKAESAAWEISHSRAQEMLAQLKAERLVEQIETSLHAAHGDAKAASDCHGCLLNLKGKLDEIEDLLEWPMLVLEAEEQLRKTRRVIAEHGNEAEKQHVVELERQTRQTIADSNKDSFLLQRKVDELWHLGFAVLWRQPEYVVNFFYHLESRKALMSDPAAAARLLERGKTAIGEGDIQQVKECVGDLLDLLPYEQGEEEKRAFGANVLPG